MKSYEKIWKVMKSYEKLLIPVTTSYEKLWKVITSYI